MKFLGYIFAAILITVGMFGATCGGIFIFLIGGDGVVGGLVGATIFASIASAGYKTLQKAGNGNTNFYFLFIFGILGIAIAGGAFYSIRFISFGG